MSCSSWAQHSPFSQVAFSRTKSRKGWSNLATGLKLPCTPESTSAFYWGGFVHHLLFIYNHITLQPWLIRTQHNLLMWFPSWEVQFWRGSHTAMALPRTSPLPVWSVALSLWEYGFVAGNHDRMYVKWMAVSDKCKNVLLEENCDRSVIEPIIAML